MVMCRTLEAHCGPVWALQQKNELLVSGHQDKVVRNVTNCGMISVMVENLM